MKNTDFKGLTGEVFLSGFDHVTPSLLEEAADDDALRAAVYEEAEKKRGKHLIAYECKKLLGVRYLWIFLFALLMINSAAAWYYAACTYTASEPTDLIASFFEEYESSPEEIDAHYEEMQAFRVEQQNLLYAAMQQGDYDYEVETMPSIYSDDDSYPDSILFAKLYKAVNAAKDYPAALDNVIRRAEANMSSLLNMGVTEDSFTYRYQLRVIELYKELRDNVVLEVNYSRGWEEYFSYETVNIFIFFMLMLFGSVIFSQEKQSGFLPIIRTAKHGRAKTAAAKIIAMLLASVFITLVFTFSTFAVFGLRLGFSSSDSVLQTLSTFTYSPYRITVGEYFIITVGMKLLSFALFSMLLVLCAVFFYNMVLVFFAGLSVFGISFLLYKLQYLNANSIFRNLNLITAASVTRLFERYRAFDLFGSAAGFVPAMLIIFPAIILLCAAVTVYRFARDGDAIRIPFVDSAVSFVMLKAAGIMSSLRRTFTARTVKKKTSARKITSRSYSRSLVAAECFKTLISSRFIIIVLAILCVKSWYSVRINTPSDSYADAVYREYMTELEGALTEEKLAYISAERQSINETLSKQKYMQAAYLSGEVNLDEYRKYLSEYNYAYSRSEFFTVIENHAAYLQNKEAQTGIRGWFVYDTGWNRLYGGDADLFLYASILLLFVGSFAAEYVTKSSAGSFARLLRSTKNGRSSTFNAKLLSSGVITFIISLITVSIDIFTVFRGYDMPAWNAPLCSVESFGAVSGHITIGQYLILFVLMRIAAALLLALMICALSELLARYLPVLGCSVLLTLLPALCVSLGLSSANRINFLNLFAGTPLFLSSASQAWFGNGYSMLVLWLVIALVCVIAMLFPARKTFVK